MKYLIVYMSHHGTTQKIVSQMARHFGIENTRLINLKSDNVPDLTPFTNILIGGSIHTGAIQKEIKDFCIHHEEELLKKRIGLFICSMESHEKESEFIHAFPERLRNHAAAHGYFGGELLLDKMNFFEKLFVKVIYGNKKSLSQIDEKAIEVFEQKMSH